MSQSAEKKLQSEFNQWAEAGRGDEMERHHMPIFEPMLPLLDVKPGDRVLDLGCGSGWATRLVAKRFQPREIVGIDISDEMVRRAAEQSNGIANIEFLRGAAEKIPLPDSSIDKIFSIESFYYWPDQVAGLAEAKRVLAPGGKLFILINLYKDNHHSLRWADELKVPVHALSEVEYLDLLSKAGYEGAEARRIPDPSPTPDDYSGKWFKNANELREFKKIGALLLIASRP
jgi:ubiquinone/menaquinone biosynthesis C-methylase UbiE